jgi:hypothetical protein
VTENRKFVNENRDYKKIVIFVTEKGKYLDENRDKNYLFPEKQKQKNVLIT